MPSALIGRDRRFVYVYRSMWRGSEAESLGHRDCDLALPPWVAAWIAAGDDRPWPPAQP